MILYHFTSEYHWKAIEEAGVIRLTESNVSLTEMGRGPNVVWLLDSDAVEYEHGLSSLLDKTAVRITVDAPAIKWLDWSYPHLEPEIREILIVTGGGMEAAEHWYVHTQEIHSKDWVEVKHMNSNE
jgi:hypothetical protein